MERAKTNAGEHSGAGSLEKLLSGTTVLSPGDDDHLDIPTTETFNSSTTITITITTWARLDDTARGSSALLAKPV